MSTLNRKFVVAVVMACCCSVPATSVHAGPFLDWLFARPVLVYPANSPAPVAVTANYAPTYAYSTAQPVNNLQQFSSQPYTAAYPPVASQPTYSSVPTYNAAPVVVGYAPDYQTAWRRVPVTYYRPTTTPVVANYAAPNLQACNSYVMQPQRIRPLLRPWWSWRPTYILAPNYAGVANGSYYAPNSTLSTGMPVTYGSPMSACSACGATQSAYPAASGVPGSSVPADQRPALQPGEIQNQGAAANPASLQFNGTSPQGTVNRANPNYERPIPDANLYRANDNNPAPPLLENRDRTAGRVVENPMRVMHATWQVSKPSPVQPAVATSPAPAVPAAPRTTTRWDDSGWKSSSW